MTPRRVAAAALAAGTLGAALVPGSPPGIGLTLVVAAVAGVVALAAAGFRRERLLYAGLGLALAAAPAVIAAPWVVAVALAAAAVLLALAATGGVQGPALARAVPRVAGLLGPAPSFLARSLAPARPAPAGWHALGRGAALAIAGVAVFGALFLSADRAFAQLAHELLLPRDLALLGTRVVVLAGTAVVAGALALATPAFAGLAPDPVPLRVRLGIEEPAEPLRLRRAEWAVPLVALDLLFAAFVLVQLTVLFGGHDHVLATAGLTYAEYARQGFFQLVAVATLVLAVVAAATRWSVRETPRDRRLLTILLCVLCALTLVVLASAMRRLGLYEQVFGYTRTRLLVEIAIVWLAGILLLVLAAGIAPRRGWLPLATVILTATVALGFTFSSPDARIATRNVERYERTGTIDVGYLSTLSADAVPALLRLPEPLRSCALAPVRARVGTGDDVGGWNLSRARARSLLDAPGVPGPRCPPAS